MKIWQVLHGFPPELSGGTERTVEALARAMQARGHELRIVAGSTTVSDPARPLETEFDGLPVTRLHRDDLYFESFEKAWSPAVSDAFRQLIRRERPEVVHVHHWIRLTTDLVRVAESEGVPVTAVHLHDYWTQQASPVRRAGTEAPQPPPAPAWMNAAELAESFALHRDDLCSEIRAARLRFAPCQAHADGLRSFADHELGPIEVSTPPLLEVPERRPQRSEFGHRLLFFGSVYPDKGLSTVLEALGRAKTRWSLTVLGAVHDETYRRELDRLARGLDVEFAGAFDRAALKNVDADVVVLPSICHESYGLVLDEARALGFPVLASDLASLREHADPDATLWFRPGSADELAALLDRPEAIRSLPRPAVPQLVRPQDEADRLLSFYERARGGEFGPASPSEGPSVDAARRARSLFRRAERRLWSSLQNGGPVPPPDEFLGPADDPGAIDR